jgi:hypothetical protein
MPPRETRDRSHPQMIQHCDRRRCRQRNSSARYCPHPSPILWRAAAKASADSGSLLSSQTMRARESRTRQMRSSALMVRWQYGGRTTAPAHRPSQRALGNFRSYPGCFFAWAARAITGLPWPQDESSSTISSGSPRRAGRLCLLEIRAAADLANRNDGAWSASSGRAGRPPAAPGTSRRYSRGCSSSSIPTRLMSRIFSVKWARVMAGRELVFSNVHA